MAPFSPNAPSPSGGDDAWTKMRTTSAATNNIHGGRRMGSLVAHGVDGVLRFQELQGQEVRRWNATAAALNAVRKQWRFTRGLCWDGEAVRSVMTLGMLRHVRIMFSVKNRCHLTGQESFTEDPPLPFNRYLLPNHSRLKVTLLNP